LPILKEKDFADKRNLMSDSLFICFIAPFAYPLLSKDCADSTGGAERQFFCLAENWQKEDDEFHLLQVERII